MTAKKNKAHFQGEKFRGKIMSVRIMSKVWDTDTPTHSMKLVLLALARLSSENRECETSISEIARLCCLSRQSAIYNLKRLVSSGFIEKSIKEFGSFYLISEMEGNAKRRKSPRKYRKISASKRAAVMARDNFSCAQCGCEKDLSIDHIHPVSRGGSDHESNLQTLCRPCNSRKGNRV